MRGDRGPWVVVAFLVLLIYATLPIGPAVWRRIAGTLGAGADDLAAVVLVALALGLGYRFRSRLRAGGGLTLAACVLVAGVYAAALAWVPLTPAERTHFVSYGVLTLAVWRALARSRRSSWRRAGVAAVLVALVGLGDEVLQYLLPGRFFEWKDVALNAVSGVLPLLPVLSIEPAGSRLVAARGPSPVGSD